MEEFCIGSHNDRSKCSFTESTKKCCEKLINFSLNFFQNFCRKTPSCSVRSLLSCATHVSRRVADASALTKHHVFALHFFQIFVAMRSWSGLKCITKYCTICHSINLISCGDKVEIIRYCYFLLIRVS